MTILLLVVIIVVGIIIIMQTRNIQDGTIDKNKSVATIITNWLTFLSSPAKGDELLVATERPLPPQDREEFVLSNPIQSMPSQPPEELPSLPLDPLPSQPGEESPSLPLDSLPSQPGDESPSLPLDPLPMPRTQVTTYPKNWGPKPSIETKDIVELPNDYGYGSSTIKAWIEYNMKRDKRRENLESAKSYEFMCMVDVMIEAIEQGNLTNEFVEKHKDILEAITSKEMGTLQTIDHVGISTFVDDVKGQMGVKLFDIMVNVSDKYPNSLCKKEIERLQAKPDIDPEVIMSHINENIYNPMPVIDILKDESTTLEDKVTKVTEELIVQVPDISNNDLVDIVNTVVEGEASLQNESDISSKDIIKPDNELKPVMSVRPREPLLRPIKKPGFKVPGSLADAISENVADISEDVLDGIVNPNKPSIPKLPITVTPGFKVPGSLADAISENVADISEDVLDGIVNPNKPSIPKPKPSTTPNPPSSSTLKDFQSKMENVFKNSLTF